jgi:tRNA pseudouridine55 synthase
MSFAEGIYKFNKPLNWTSFDVVNWVKHRAVTRKVGHAGTLDPAAQGLLIICVGRLFTKNIDLIANEDKEYVFEITFGTETDSYDSEGKITYQNNNFTLTEETLRNVLQLFHGEQQQIPPMHSAVKHQGQRLYKLARAGKEVEREPRNITIKELDLLAFDGKKAKIRTVCSKGTYIRSLCYDIGRKLGIGAYMSQLTRTKIGDYLLDDTCLIPESTREVKTA